MKEAEASAETVEVEVKSLNKGGLVVECPGEIKGFIPYNQMGVEKPRKGEVDDISFLVGKKIGVKVVSVDQAAGNVIMSEKRVAQSSIISRLKVGDSQRAVVRNVEDYGAFVDFTDVPHVGGLVHKSELSWDTFLSVDDVVQAGQKVTVKILEADPVACRVALSIKQMQQDPLTQTMETAPWGPTKTIPADIQGVVDRLSAHQSISSVTPLQQADESHHFAQELQVFLTKTEVQGGYLVVARAGSILQQLQLASSLSRDDMKTLLQQVVKVA